MTERAEPWLQPRRHVERVVITPIEADSMAASKPRNDRPAPAFNARIIHLALMAGIVLFVATTTFVSRKSAPATSAPSAALIYAPFFVGASAFMAALFLRGRLLPRPADMSEDDWWLANQQRVIIVWALLEGPCLFGVASYYITGHPLPLVVTVAGLLLFLLTAPGRLARS
jgi:hypothetical protein